MKAIGIEMLRDHLLYCPITWHSFYVACDKLLLDNYRMKYLVCIHTNTHTVVKPGILILLEFVWE